MESEAPPEAPPFERSLGDESATRTLRIGSHVYPPYVLDCAQNNPVTCPYPGAAVDVLKLLAMYHNAKFDLIHFNSKGFGFPAEGNTTAMRAVVEGSVDMVGPEMWYGCV